MATDSGARSYERADGKTARPSIENSAAPILRDRNNNIVPLSKRFNLGGSQYLGRSAYERADGKAARVSAKERKLRDAIVDLLRKAGIEVVTESEEGQRVLDMANGRGVTLNKAQKRTLETARLNQQEEGTKGTVVSSEDGAKVLKNLDILAESLEKITNRSKTFVGDVAKALGAKQFGSKSQYATFETKNGQTVTIRLGNHNATVSSFDNNGEDNGISIVISRHENKGITNDGNAHLVEYFYSDKAINRAEGKPLADIVRSIKQALYSGEYKDTTGLAEREEVNAEQVRMHRGYHGSGADFERFDHSHMGEGEGAQSFGWGTYVTEVEGIGRHYAENLPKVWFRDTESGYEVDWEEVRDNWEEGVKRSALLRVFENARGADYNMEEAIENAISEIEGREGYEEELAFLRQLTADNFEIDRNLYTVEIPEDNGSNYLDWTKTIPKSDRRRIADAVRGLAGEPAQSVKYANYTGGWGQLADMIERNQWAFQEVRDRLLEAFGGRIADDKKVSELMHSAGFVGIKYPAEYYSGGRSDGAKNYVIFDEGDLQITDKVKLFRTESGEAYGFTMGGKIYLDPKIATAETPIHEYTHLWAAAMRQANPKAWEQLKSELEKDKELVAYVRRLYPELAGENGANGLSDELADEMFAHFSGRRGAERLREEQRKAMDEASDYVEKAGVVAMFERLRDALKKFWNMARDLFAGKTRGIKSRSAEGFADMVLADLVGGYDPRADSGRVTKAEDEAYMKAVESGDMETARRMVDEAARKAGYTIHAYHGSPNDFTKFNLKYLGSSGATHEGYGFYFTDKKEIAHIFATQKGTEGKIYDVYLKIEKPISDTERTITKGQLRTLLTELGKQENEDEINPLSNYGDTDREGVSAVVNNALTLEDEGNENDADLLGSIINTTGEMELVFDILRQKLGYDGIIVKNPDWGKKVGQTIYLAFHPDQIKSTDPVTYDDAGNVIPLSERFNSGNADIRYEKVGGDENDNRAVTIIGAEKEHGFANFGEARKWAKKNIVGEYNNPEIGGVNISGTAIDKYLSEKAVSKSDNKDVHLSALKVMPSIIENSIVGEVHEDKKGDRHLKDVVRLYGAIDIDGQSYRVKTTVKRYNSENEKSKAYSYEVTEIELLEGTHGDDNNGELPRSGNNSISAAKLLNISETAKNNSQETEREEIVQRDKEYAEAVAVGDKEKIDAMLREEMRRKGYADNSDYQGSLAFNGAAPSSNAYFETREERKEAFDNGELEGDFSLGDFMEAGIDTHDLEWQLANPIAASARDKATLESINNLRSAVRGKKKTIKMYRAVPADLKEGSFRNGDWVTPSRKYAEQHIELQDWEGGRIIEQEVSVDDIWWNGDDINEWGFDDGKGYAYKNTENNRKLMEPTYDDNGNRTPEDGQGARTPEDGQGARAPLGSFNPAYL